jgi:hypothetical protein
MPWTIKAETYGKPTGDIRRMSRFSLVQTRRPTATADLRWPYVSRGTAACVMGGRLERRLPHTTRLPRCRWSQHIRLARQRNQKRVWPETQYFRLLGMPTQSLLQRGHVIFNHGVNGNILAFSRQLSSCGPVADLLCGRA